MIIKILGSGCSRCNTLEKKVREVVESNGVDALVQKVTDLQQIMDYGVMSTPAIVINERLISSGMIPKDEQILEWIKEAK